MKHTALVITLVLGGCGSEPDAAAPAPADRAAFEHGAAGAPAPDIAHLLELPEPTVAPEPEPDGSAEPAAPAPSPASPPAEAPPPPAPELPPALRAATPPTPTPPTPPPAMACVDIAPGPPDSPVLDCTGTATCAGAQQHSPWCDYTPNASNGLPGTQPDPVLPMGDCTDIRVWGTHLNACSSPAGKCVRHEAPGVCRSAADRGALSSLTTIEGWHTLTVLDSVTCQPFDYCL